MKICTNELGHLTNMATMPIYGKDLFLETIAALGLKVA